MDELFNLVDIDGSGIMEWSEFETFVANEIQEGRDFMEGEFVLPSGAGIQFAAMVDVLRRKSRLQAVMKVGTPCTICNACLQAFGSCPVQHPLSQLADFWLQAYKEQCVLVISCLFDSTLDSLTTMKERSQH